MTEPGEITRLLRAYGGGDDKAFDRLVPLVYDELRRIARGQLRRNRPLKAMETGSLVHELYVKLAQHGEASWQNRSHFFAVAARAMRQILVDLARRHSRQKRGGRKPDLELKEELIGSESRSDMLLAVNELLVSLQEHAPRLVRVIECRFFAGYTGEETAEILGVSTRTVERDWRRARAWMQEAIRSRREDGAKDE